MSMENELTLKEALDALLGEVKFDQRLAQRCHHFQVAYVHRSRENMEFFGGNLIGVQRIHFTHREINNYVEEILNVDFDEVKYAVSQTTTINHSFEISGDAFNLLLLYMIHRFLTSPYLDPNRRLRGAIDVGLVFNYRTIAILIAKYFKYPIDTETAQAVYERLSGRYLIKKFGTWQKFFEYRSHEFAAEKSTHYQTLIKFNNDPAIQQAVNDFHGRVKDTMKNIYATFIAVHEEGSKIGSSSNTMIDADGEEIVKDRVHGLENYQHYLSIVMADPQSFIKAELFNVIIRTIPTVSEKAFKRLLEWISTEMSSTHRKAITELSELILVLAFNYLLKHEYVLHRSKDMVLLVSKLKGYIISSREDSEDLDKFRKLGNAIVVEATGKTSEQTVAALRNALFLYICLRAFAKHAYS